MNKLALVLLLLSILLLPVLTEIMIVNLVKANPINNDIAVESPLEDTIYNSTEVPLKFKVIDPYQINYTYPNDDVYGHNYTSFSYSLDGHQFIETNGGSILRDLTNGSHTLEIYGVMPYTNGSIWYNNSVHPTIHFDVFYHSTSSSDNFPTMLMVAIVIVSVVGVAVAFLVYSKKYKHERTLVKNL